MTVFAHHRGLPSIVEEEERGQFCYRIPETEPGKEPLYKRTQSRLASYRELHRRVVKGLEPLRIEPVQEESRQMMCRIALSCLVDADHFDTARHYGNAPSKIAPDLHSGKRLASLDAYVARLSSGKSDERTRLRKRFTTFAAMPIRPPRSSSATARSGRGRQRPSWRTCFAPPTLRTCAVFSWSFHSPISSTRPSRFIGRAWFSPAKIPKPSSRPSITRRITRIRTPVTWPRCGTLRSW